MIHLKGEISMKLKKIENHVSYLYILLLIIEIVAFSWLLVVHAKEGRVEQSNAEQSSVDSLEKQAKEKTVKVFGVENLPMIEPIGDVAEYDTDPGPFKVEEDATAEYVSIKQPEPTIQPDDTSRWASITQKEKRKRNNKKNEYIHLSESEITIFASLIFFEGGAESVESQRAIASVVINRMKMDNLSLRQVVFAKNQFEPAYLIGNKHIDDKYMKKSKKIVQYVCKNGPTIPPYVTYFRADYYHNWSGMVPYKKIDQTYFSYEQSYYNRYIKQKKSNT